MSLLQFALLDGLSTPLTVLQEGDAHSLAGEYEKAREAFTAALLHNASTGSENVLLEALMNQRLAAALLAQAF